MLKSITNRKGIILAGGSGTRLYPLTISVSKQLMPVYDKPMIYYPLSVLMLGGMREVLIITTPQDLQNFKNLLGDGKQLGIEITYAVQDKPNGLAQALIIAEDFLSGSPSCLILGDNLFYGGSFIKSVKNADENLLGATIFAYWTAKPWEYGVVEFDKSNKVVSLEEKPIKPKSNYAVPGIYFYDKFASSYAKNLKPSKRGELEITDLNKIYLEKEQLNVEKLGRGIAWLDTGSADSLAEASDFIRVIQHRQGLKIACIEQIAFDNGWLDKEELKKIADSLHKTEYGRYLHYTLRFKNQI